MDQKQHDKLIGSIMDVTDQLYTNNVDWLTSANEINITEVLVVMCKRIESGTTALNRISTILDNIHTLLQKNLEGQDPKPTQAEQL